MRLYCKLGMLALLACVTQTTLTSDAAREAYFAARCYVAHRSCDRELEDRLVNEFQLQLAAECRKPVMIVAAAHDAGLSR